jgi:hypothetical protein
MTLSVEKALQLVSMTCLREGQDDFVLKLSTEGVFDTIRYNIVLIFCRGETICFETAIENTRRLRVSYENQL